MPSWFAPLGEDGDGDRDGHLQPSDADELARRFDVVDAEHAARFGRQLVRRLHLLVDREVPARGVEPVPAWGAARLRFADGTTVVVRGASAGDLGVLAGWVRRRSVVPRAVSGTGPGARLTFAAPDGRRQLDVVVRGFDQPD